MNILITNDDGISSPGIKALEKVLKKSHNTFLIAPLKERSATSQAISIFEKMRVEKVMDNHYIVDGYPTDCVNIGLHGKIFPEIDMVISGINRGVNMGHDVHFSGTVGAARHGAIHNKIAWAISSGKVERHSDYTQEAEVILELIEKKISIFQKGLVYNFNFPVQYSHKLDDIKITKLGNRTYTDDYHKKKIIGEIYEYYLGGSELSHEITKDSDFEAFYSGKISMTPVSLDTTDFSELNRLQAAL